MQTRIFVFCYKNRRFEKSTILPLFSVKRFFFDFFMSVGVLDLNLSSVNFSKIKKKNRTTLIYLQKLK
jgi:hypothetical protein